MLLFLLAKLVLLLVLQNALFWALVQRSGLFKSLCVRPIAGLGNTAPSPVRSPPSVVRLIVASSLALPSRKHSASRNVRKTDRAATWHLIFHPYCPVSEHEE